MPRQLEEVILLRRDTLDGYDFILDEVPIGKIYTIDRSTAKLMKWGKTDGRPAVWRMTVNTFEHGKFTGWLPLELFEEVH